MGEFLFMNPSIHLMESLRGRMYSMLPLKASEGSGASSEGAGRASEVAGGAVEKIERILESKKKVNLCGRTS